MTTKSSKVYYRIDLRRTLESMDLHAPASVRIAGLNRDCEITSIYHIKNAIEKECDKRFTITKQNLGKTAEITRIR